MPKKRKHFDLLLWETLLLRLLSIYEDSFVGIFEKFSKKTVVNLGVVSYAQKLPLKINYYLTKGYSFDHVVIPIDISDLYDDNVSYRLNKDYIVTDNYERGKT